MAALYPIGPGMPVRMLDGGMATICDVRAHPVRPQESALVLKVDALRGAEVLVGHGAVAYVDGTVHLRLSTAEVVALPRIGPWAQRGVQLTEAGTGLVDAEGVAFPTR